MLSAHSKDHVDCVSRVLRNAARLPQAPVPTPILDSWRRSMEQHRLDPGSLQGPRILSQTLLDECRERSELFLRIASEEVARLHGRVRDADYCVLLTDAQGRTIDYRVESTIRNDCRKAGLYLGTCWSEGEEGTCGVAAVLTDRTAVTVHKRDHFRAAFIDLTCSAAPVFDPQGELLGVLDVSAVQSPDDRRSQHLIRQMVAQSAREIENAFFMHSAQGHWVLRAHRAPGYVDSQPDYLFAWDADGRLLALNPAARHYLRQRLGQVPSHIGEVFDLDALHAAADQAPCLLRGQAGELHVRLSAPRAKARRLEREVPDDAALDPRIAESLRLAVRVKDRNLPVLIQGETGAGKEVFARQLHQASARRDKPFVALNCAAIPESLIESELFGYVGGAFTGAAAKGMRGLLQQADGGTLFLDEIGDMPLALQGKLLRVLQEKEFEAVGSNEVIRSDIRLVAATSIDLQQAMREGRFRADLYYRLNVLPIEIPPLRQRLDDLPALCESILDSLDHGRLHELGGDALALLARHAWPGNVRELRNVLERALLLADQRLLDAAALGAALGPLQPLPELPRAADDRPVGDFQQAREAFERDLIGRALAQSAGNVVEAAKRLGLGRSTLYKKIVALGMRLDSGTRLEIETN